MTRIERAEDSTEMSIDVQARFTELAATGRNLVVVAFTDRGSAFYAGSLIVRFAKDVARTAATRPTAEAVLGGLRRQKMLVELRS